MDPQGIKCLRGANWFSARFEEETELNEKMQTNFILIFFQSGFPAMVPSVYHAQADSQAEEDNC